ncbi:MAG: restriction endonuclease [Candidatus Nealsonbacteria bacterium]|nr:restriction endonuclease [Candidatus Nealsonbacteria bacterium]
MGEVTIIKASGEREKFESEKIYQSLKRAGADATLAEKISGQVKKEISSGDSSANVLQEVSRRLRRENPILAARYNLKRAIMDLGPTGFPFERYVAKILEAYGYRTKVGQLVRGQCVSHEIDVVAQKGNEHFMIECKYHNTRGLRSDVKVALYTYARFLDVKKAWEKIPGHRYLFHQAWLVTNTKCTSQAVNYARCAGLKIVSWRYPRNESLEYLIEKKKLYPVTILFYLPRFLKERLAQSGLMLVKDLIDYSVEDLAKTLGIQLNLARKLRQEAEKLCLCF